MQLYLIWQISKFMGKGIVITDIFINRRNSVLDSLERKQQSGLSGLFLCFLQGINRGEGMKIRLQRQGIKRNI